MSQNEDFICTNPLCIKGLEIDRVKKNQSFIERNHLLVL